MEFKTIKFWKNCSFVVYKHIDNDCFPKLLNFVNRFWQKLFQKLTLTVQICKAPLFKLILSYIKVLFEYDISKPKLQ